MAIPVLDELYGEVRRLAIAGSSLAGDDFRLKKLIPPLRKAGERAPVLGKVAEAAEKVVGSSSANSAEALLDLSTLVMAILYTQGETGTEGDFEPFEGGEVELVTTNTSARVLKPLLEALTSTGSGRLEAIREGFDRKAFSDLRLLRPALGAIDDPYPEIGEYVAENVLPVYGKAIYEDIRGGFKLKGKGGDARRLKLLHRLDPTASQALIDEALEEGSKDVKLAALECLDGRPDALPILLEQSTAKNGEVRRAAITSLATFTEEEAVAGLIEALGSAEYSHTAVKIRENKSPKLLKFLVEECQRLAKAGIAETDKKKQAETLGRLPYLLEAFVGRSDKKTLRMLDGFFDDRAAFAQAKGTGRHGDDVIDRVACLMVHSQAPTSLRKLIAATPEIDADLLGYSLLAALQIEKPAKVYKDFSPYFTEVPAPKNTKKRSPEEVKRETVASIISMLAKEDSYYFGRYSRDSFDKYFGRTPAVAAMQESTKLDRRWLEAALKADEVELVLGLAQPGDKAAVAYLEKQFEVQFRRDGWRYEAQMLLGALLKLGSPRSTELYLGALTKSSKNKQMNYNYHWLARLSVLLPAKAAPELEALLPSFPEPLVDELAPHLAELKARK